MNARFILRWMLLATLFALAAPVYLSRWLLSLRRTLRALHVIRAGRAECDECGMSCSLTPGRSRCPVCGFVGASSLLRCDNCRTSFRTITCPNPECGSTIRIY